MQQPQQQPQPEHRWPRLKGVLRLAPTATTTLWSPMTCQKATTRVRWPEKWPPSVLPRGCAGLAPLDAALWRAL